MSVDLPMPSRALVVTGLAKHYGGKQAVVDASFAVAPGEIVALMGPNGAGKTTLYRMLIGAESPDRGRIVIDGLEVTNLPSFARARCGLSHLPQESSAFVGLSVADNIMLALENHENDPVVRARRLDELLDETGLTALRRRKPGQLSGGERRRCEIARMLAVEPRYLLLDEPFAGLDPKSIAQVRARVQALASRGIGILITDHNLRETLSIAARAIVIAGGHIVRDATPDAVLDDPALRSMWLGDDFVM